MKKAFLILAGLGKLSSEWIRNPKKEELSK